MSPLRPELAVILQAMVIKFYWRMDSSHEWIRGRKVWAVITWVGLKVKSSWGWGEGGGAVLNVGSSSKAGCLCFTLDVQYNCWIYPIQMLGFHRQHHTKEKSLYYIIKTITYLWSLLVLVCYIVPVLGDTFITVLQPQPGSCEGYFVC